VRRAVGNGGKKRGRGTGARERGGKNIFEITKALPKDNRKKKERSGGTKPKR